MVISEVDPRLAPIWLRKELLGQGHNDKTLARAVRAGTLRRPRTGAYVDGPLWDAMGAEHRFAVRARAAVLQAKTGVIVSHAAALPFNEAPMWGVDLREVDLTRADGRTGRREAGIRQHSGQLLPGDTIEAYGLTRSSPLRNALEMTTLTSVEVALAIVNHFLHRGDFALEEIRSRYESGMEHWPHSLKTDLTLRLADPRIESVGESRLHYLMWKQRLPSAIPQYEVYDGSVLVARLDFALPDYNTWIEFDGLVKYREHVRPGESASEVVVREKRREDAVRKLTGWRCLRIAWDELADPVRLAARISEFLRRGHRASAVG